MTTQQARRLRTVTTLYLWSWLMAGDLAGRTPTRSNRRRRNRHN